ncbi:aminoglycoside 6-adenylyltransferase [Listeria sp. FSL L7-1582]|nr:aminoglycoside 6-adenylyltransferase [Listeria portnoyi]
MMHKMLEKIVMWGKQQDSVRALVLEGSLAKQQDVDELSDLDINVWFTGEVPFGKTVEWLADIDDILIENQLHMETPAGEVATQLVIFQNGIKVDFSFWPIAYLENPFPYYEKKAILVDKGAYTDQIKRCIREKAKPPMEKADFDKIVNEFWFELHYVAKFLKRKEIWFVQDIQAGIRTNYLLPMLEEQARITKRNPSFSGRKIGTWLDPAYFNRLPSIFADYSLEANWQAMWAEIVLFEEVSHFISQHYQFELPTAKIEGMKRLLQAIQEG